MNKTLNLFLSILLIATVGVVIKDIIGGDREREARHQNLGTPHKIIHGTYGLTVPPDYSLELMNKEEMMEESGLTEEDLMSVGISDMNSSYFMNSTENSYGYTMWLRLTPEASYNLSVGTKNSVINGITALGGGVKDLNYNQTTIFDNEALEVKGTTSIKSETMNVKGHYILDNQDVDYRQVVGILIIDIVGNSGSKILQSLRRAESREEIMNLLFDD